ncbi:anti-sigma factor antagonist [Streptomyces sp. ISL-66]|uniref:STAS domain-containing protein n=1 Tax=Streptomyces sp. ISL-66 TaxID=2819186 RepID=UPI001BE5D9FD|nr:STAS domain-containing protein [Streptomyces sp. ISL-66]MBT2470039.1 anti-sigma factor antagonist [Streptomyces sp. ISL-66]
MPAQQDPHRADPDRTNPDRANPVQPHPVQPVQPDPGRQPAEGPAHSAPETVVIRLSGEMDITRVSEVRAALLHAVTRADGPLDIVVDLSGLTFCDSSGLNVLLRARLEAVESGHTLRLAAPNPQMVRLLELTGALGLFPVDPAPPA